MMGLRAGGAGNPRRTGPLLGGGLVVVLLSLWFGARRQAAAPVDAPSPDVGPVAAPPGAPASDPDGRVRSAGSAERPDARQGGPAPAGAAPGDEDRPDPEDTGRAEDEIPVFTSDARGFRAAMRDRMPAIRECYEGWLELQPQLAGELVVQFVLEPPEAGADVTRVQNVDLVDSDVPNPVFEGCVLASLEDLRFEPLDSMKVFTYPLRFSTEAPK
jgi:hypothetical protein